ncbi:LytR/AlgR family response regulator transcription factor [Bacteroidota bacterium]
MRKLKRSSRLVDILIIDDEQEVHDLLTIMLRSYKGAIVVGHATRVDEAVRLTLDKNPDLVFLDIHMPEKDGFTYIKELQKKEVFPGIIFITAHENYAIQAIRNSAFDYLLKPVNKEELFDAIHRYERNISRNSRNDLHQLAELINSGKPDRLRLNTRTGYVFVNPKEIIYIEADGNYSIIHLVNNRTEITTMSLGMLEAKLESTTFLRISRSYILNMTCISRVDRRENTCELDYLGCVHTVKIPSQKIKLLEDYF